MIQIKWGVEVLVVVLIHLLDPNLTTVHWKNSSEEDKDLCCCHWLLMDHWVVVAVHFQDRPSWDLRFLRKIDDDPGLVLSYHDSRFWT